MAKKTKLFETHVRLSMSDKRAVEIIARREQRSISSQIAVFVRRAITAESDDNETLMKSAKNG